MYPVARRGKYGRKPNPFHKIADLALRWRLLTMAFPETRHSLIHRLATGGDDTDWKQFLRDYWGPITRFAMHRSHLNIDDAEDVASQTFQALLQNELLVRWTANRSSKFRTLLCAVTRNVLSNRARVAIGRQALMKKHGKDLAANPDTPTIKSMDASDKQTDEFYGAWVEELLFRVTESLFADYRREGKSDYFRVLFSRLCEDMSHAEIADALELPEHSVKNHFRAAKKRLGNKLKASVREHVTGYCAQDDIEDEFTDEWKSLQSFLLDNGGLEQAIHNAYTGFEPAERAARLDASIDKAIQTIRKVS